MIDLGKVNPGSSVVVPFHTFDSNDPSASVAIAAFIVGDIEIYRDGDITAGAERSSDTGVVLIDTDGIDLDGIVGIGGATIDLSSNADAGFWRAGSQYTVIIGPVTVDAAVVNFIPVTFKIGYDGAFRETTIESVTSQTALVLAAGVAPPDDNAFNGCRAIIHDVATADQWSFVDVIDYDAGTRTITLAAGAIFTVAGTDNISFFPPALHATRAAVLDDWINGGRLDLLLDGLIAKFVGITLLNEWLGAIAGKQNANATALTEMKATGAGSGTYDPNTDSTEGLRDRGDAAWVTGGDATSTKQDTAQSDLDKLTGTDGATLASSQGNYAPAKVGDAMTLATDAVDAVAVDTDVYDELLDFAAGVDTDLTLRQHFRLAAAAAYGKASGLATTSAKYRNIPDDVDAITATVDADGNRSAVTLDKT